MHRFIPIIIVMTFTIICVCGIHTDGFAQAWERGEAYALSKSFPIAIMPPKEVTGLSLFTPVTPGEKFQSPKGLRDQSYLDTYIQKVLENSIRVMIRVWTW